MAEPKEANLNESYYGPTIPPLQTQRRIRTIRTTGRCGTPYSLLCTLFKIITIILIIIGILVLILWLVSQPNDLKAYVDNASLTRFDFAPNRTLYYNLTLDLSIRNPNKKVGIDYEHIEARAFYHGSRFGYMEFPPFHQGHKNTTVLHPSFGGQAVALGESVSSTFSREKEEGWFYISVKVYTKVRLKMIVIKTAEYKPEVDCDLRLPAPANATSVAVGFVRTRCNVGAFS